jgi:putative salt-induced outer membrane protein YdiY
VTALRRRHRARALLRRGPACVLLGLVLATGRAAAAQEGGQPAAPPKPWTTAAGVGLALTSGNSETSTFNANYEVVFDPRARNMVKSDGLLIRGRTEGELSSDRIALNARDEFRINGHAFVFVQNQYLRDSFKEIDYLLAPTAGFGYRLVDADATTLSVNAGLGGVWEKNPDASVRASGAVTLDQNLSHTAWTTTTFTQSFAGLWKTEDLNDALYQISAGIAVAMTARTQVKVQAIDTFKNRPPGPTIQKNDLSLIVAFVFKN